jgi:hypothetical protein
MKMIRNCSRTKIAIKAYMYNDRKIRVCSSLTELQPIFTEKLTLYPQKDGLWCLTPL